MQDESEVAPSGFVCPITLELMVDPVMAADGQSYERSAIETWLKGNDTAPKTNIPLPNKNITPNISLQQSIEEWRSRHFRIKRLDDVTIGEQIGHGSSKAVFMGTLKRAGRSPLQVAVLKVRGNAGSLVGEALKLIELGRHQSLIRYIGMCDEGGVQLLLTEYAQHGSVLNVFNAREQNDEERQLPVGLAIQLLTQICSGMEVLSSGRVFHCDLAARNILVSSYSATEITVKICDFGLAKDAQYNTHVTGAACQIAPRWISPEVSLRRQFSEKSDVWAFAVTAWEVFTGGIMPFHRIIDDREVMRFIEEGRIAEHLVRPDDCPDALWALLRQCWEMKPAKRPSFERLGKALEVLKQGGDTAAVMAALDEPVAGQLALLAPSPAPAVEVASSSQAADALLECSPAERSPAVPLSKPKAPKVTPALKGPKPLPEPNKKPRLGSKRPERQRPKPPPELADFPPGRCEINAPTKAGEFRWYPVVGHEAGQLRILDTDEVHSLSLQTGALLDKWNEVGRDGMVRSWAEEEAVAAGLPPAELTETVAASPSSAEEPSAPMDVAGPASESDDDAAENLLTWDGPSAPAVTAASEAARAARTAGDKTAIGVKLEQMENSSAQFQGGQKNGESLAREAHRAAFQTTRLGSQLQKDGEPRRTFRAGCHPQCMTQSLGGCGTDDLRFANEDYYTTFDGPKQIIVDGEEKLTGERQLLIAKGEIYYWGRADWNPWAPSYAGDVGMYLWPHFEQVLRDAAAANGWDGKEGRRGPQTQFHVFRQCTNSPELQPYSAWHGAGPGRKGSNIYCGVYEVEEAGAGTINFKEFFPYTQQAHAELTFRRENDRKKGAVTNAESEKQLEFMLTEPEFTVKSVGKEVVICKSRSTDKAGRGCVRIGGADMLSVEWLCKVPTDKGEDKVVDVEQCLGGKVRLQSGKVFMNPLKRWTFYPIQFVRYDENVYNELVHAGADNSRVETDNAKLGPL